MKYTSRGEGSLFDGAQIIKDKLRERYLTQAQLAEAIGMAPAKLSEILHGHRRPSKQELINISIELDIDMSEWRKQSKYVNIVFPVLGNTYM